MIRDRALQTREKLVGKLPVTGELLRGSLLERVVRHTSGCPKCARGEGHQVYVLTVSYAGGRVRQFSVRRERVAEVRRWLVRLSVPDPLMIVAFTVAIFGLRLLRRMREDRLGTATA